MLGVETRPSGSSEETVELRACFPDRAAASHDVRRLRESGLMTDVVEIADGRWVERYQAGLRPLPLGERFVVVPGDRLPDPSDRAEIRLAPGQAFGTGEHATTRLCAAWLETRVAPGQRWLDLGTGSGVLAVVAARLGAQVQALDIDQDAVEVARAVIRDNGVPDVVRVRRGSTGSWQGPPADGVVANISERYFFEHASEIAGVLKPTGCLVASGFLAEDAREVEAALAAAGLAVAARSAEGAWRSAVAVRT